MKKKNKKFIIPKGQVGVVVKVKIIDPEDPKHDYEGIEDKLALEATKFLSILLDPEVSKVLFNEKKS